MLRVNEIRVTAYLQLAHALLMLLMSVLGYVMFCMLLTFAALRGQVPPVLLSSEAGSWGSIRRRR